MRRNIVSCLFLIIKLKQTNTETNDEDDNIVCGDEMEESND